jgi:hypothetical protein
MPSRVVIHTIPTRNQEFGTDSKTTLEVIGTSPVFTGANDDILLLTVCIVRFGFCVSVRVSGLLDGWASVAKAAAVAVIDCSSKLEAPPTLG